MPTQTTPLKRQLKVLGLVLLGLSVVAAIIPELKTPRMSNSRDACMNQLRLINGAKIQFSLEHAVTNTVTLTKEQLTPYLKMWPKCPAGGTYEIRKTGESPRCSHPAHAHYEISQALSR